MFGRGDYRLQPIHVGDLADLAVTEGARRDNVIVNAIGPETFTYRELVETLARSSAGGGRSFPCRRGSGIRQAVALGKIVGDVIVTRDEITGLMGNLLYVDCAADRNHEADGLGRKTPTAWDTITRANWHVADRRKGRKRTAVRPDFSAQTRRVQSHEAGVERSDAAGGGEERHASNPKGSQPSTPETDERRYATK